MMTPAEQKVADEIRAWQTRTKNWNRKPRSAAAWGKIFRGWLHTVSEIKIEPNEQSIADAISEAIDSLGPIQDISEEIDILKK
jgi:hypothetical protein